MEVVASNRTRQDNATVCLDVRLSERLRSGNRVIAGATVERVITQTAVNDVVGVDRPEQRALARRIRIHVERRQVDGLLERARNVDRRLLHLARRADVLLNGWCKQSVQRLGPAIGGRGKGGPGAP